MFKIAFSKIELNIVLEDLEFTLIAYLNEHCLC